jgi:hypothetical protein
VRPLLACFLLLAGCVHAPTGARTDPGQPAPPDAVPAPTSSPAPGAEAADRFTPVRTAAEALLAAQGEAAWRGWSGGEPTELAAPWKGREALLDPALFPPLGEAIAAAAGPERARLERLRAFLLGEQLARAAAQPTQALATARSAASFAWEKRTVPLRQLPALLAGEPEAPRRKAAAAAWQAAILKLEKQSATREAALLRAGAERGFATSLALAGALRLDGADRLGAIAEATLAAGDVTWPATLDALARAELGTSGPRLREHDLPRLFRTTADPGVFPADRLVADVASVLTGLGLDLSADGRLTIDAVPRPGKIPRPLAVPVEVPGQVRLSLTPLAGLDAFRALLHEVGVALSLAHVAPSAPFEDRWLPPAWHTQAWGLLLEEIASDPDWLRARGLSSEAAAREAALGAGRRVHATRVAAATVLTESARALDPAGAAARWARLGPRALGHPLDRGEPPPWRLEPDPLLRSADTLRAHLLASQLSASLSVLAGDRPWWRSKAAGDWLHQAWAGGGGWVPGPPGPGSEHRPPPP